MDKHLFNLQRDITRRHFFGRTATGVGIAALSHLMGQDLGAQTAAPAASDTGALPGLPHFAPKAKRVIYLFQSGGPSHLDLFDYKPLLNKLAGTDLPESVRQGQRLTSMTSGQSSFPLVPSKYAFQQYGQSGAWLSELIDRKSVV